MKFYSGSLEDINHNQYLENIQRKVNDKSSDNEQIRFVSSSGNSIMTLDKSNGEESFKKSSVEHVENPFETMRYFGSSNSIESYSPIPPKENQLFVMQPMKARSKEELEAMNPISEPEEEEKFEVV